MSFSKNSKLDKMSYLSTESDTSSEKDQDLIKIKTNPHKHKTQLCKTFSELGYCPYQSKCRFAHGKHELLKQHNNMQSKRRKCNGFWKNGCCSYGGRCHFGHNELSWQDRAVLKGLQALCEDDQIWYSKLLRLVN